MTTDPTPPDLSRLRPGVRFTAEFECFDADSPHRPGNWIYCTDGSFVAPDAITAIYEPPPLPPPPVAPIAVGDIVHRYGESSRPGKVLAISGNVAWAKLIDGWEYVSWAVVDCARVAAADRSGS